MTPRDTGTGWVLEQMVVPALMRGGYRVETQVAIGRRCGGGIHKVDALAFDDVGLPIAVSLKWQQSSGTAEQKVPFEVMCLAEAVGRSVNRAYLVLGGDGWKLRDYYTSGRLADHLIHADAVKVVTLEAFVRLANTSKL